MKKIIFFLFLPVLVKANFTEPHQIKTAAHTQQVTVFLTGAQLGHTSSIPFKKGKNQLVFTGLSSRLEPGSIVVDINNKNLTILSVYSHNNYLDEIAKNPKISALKDSLEKVQDKLLRLTGQKETFNREKDLLFRSDAYTADKDVKKLQDYADFCRKRKNEIDDELFRITKQETKLGRQMEQLQLQINDMQSRAGSPTAEIEVMVQAEENMEANVDLKYRVADAGWAPLYDIRVAGMGQPVNLYYKANIYNNSGVDWKEVKLKLSTADPLQGAQYPKLEAWDLEGDISKSSGYAQAQQNINNLKQTNKSVKFESIQVDELSAEFDITMPYSIYSDNRPYLVEVNSKSLNAKYEYVSVPKMDKDAFLVAKVVGWTDLSLVPGKASIYYNGSYIGQSMINITEISDTLELSLGRDNKVAVTRIKKSDIDQHEIIGNNVKETFKYEIVVRNNRDVAVNINVRDQVPMQNDSRISVNMMEMSDALYDKYKGDVDWMLALAPGESRTIVLHYSARYPKTFRAKKRSFRTISAPSF